MGKEEKIKEPLVDYWDNDIFVTHCLQCEKEIRIETLGDGKDEVKAKDFLLGGSGGGTNLFLATCIDCVNKKKLQEQAQYN